MLNSLPHIEADMTKSDRTPIFLPTPFRLARQRTASQAPAELTELFAPEADLQHKQTVWSYLEAFLPQNRQGLPKLLQDLESIWDHHGILPVDELTSQLLRRRNPELPEPALNVLHRQIESRYRDPEPLTLYDRRQHMPLSVGLGHLCAVLTGRPVSAIIVDDSNLGGLTEHMEKLLAARDGREPQKAEEGSQAYELADRVVRTMAGVARDALQDGLHTTRRMTSQNGWRTGGDERMFMVAGVEPGVLERVIETRVVPAVEEFMAAAGLHQHEHLKNRDQSLFAGTSSSFAVIPLNRYTKPTALKEAESQLSQSKTEKGQQRRGRHHPLPFSEHLSPEQADLLVRNAISQRQHFNEIAEQNGTRYPKQVHHLDRERAETDPLTGEIRWYSERHLAPYDISQTDAARLLNNLEKLLTGSRYGKYQQEPVRPEHIERNPERQEILFASPAELEALRLDYNIARSSTSLTPAQNTLVHHLLGSFSPRDPATGGWMGEVMPELFGRFAHDTEQLRNYMGAHPDAIPCPPDQVKAHAVAASMQNLAGVNKLLGSRNADLVLRHFADEIVLGSFTAAGIAPASIELGHEGSGHTVSLLRPLYEQNGALQAMTTQKVSKARSEMEKRMKKWRKQNVGDFLRKAGGDVPEGLDPGLTFGNIPDPKRASQPGLSLVTAATSLDLPAENRPKLAGSYLRNKLRDLRNDAIEQLRSGSPTQRKAAPTP